MTARHERRRQPRLTPFEWNGGVRGRIRPGHDVLVIDLSEGGALVETSRRLLPGSTAELLLDALNGRHSTRASVVRSSVCALLADLVLFRTALMFERPVPWLREEGLVGVGSGAVRAGARESEVRSG